MKGKQNKNLPTNKDSSKLIQQQETSTIIHHERLFMGALPPPDMLKEYGEFLPDLPDRLVKMVEEESQHRRTIEKSVVWHNFFVEHSRTVSGLLALAAILFVGCFFMQHGHAVEGAGIIGATLIGVIALFITRQFKKEDKNNLDT